MSNLLKISEAASLGLHTVLLLARRGDEILSNGEIAASLKVSENHLSKVLQRLSKVGIVKSVRGPRGGFTLNGEAGDISLFDVYESIDGPLAPGDCLMKTKMCGKGNECILGGLLKNVNAEVRGQLSGTKLSDLADSIGSKKQCRKKEKSSK